LFSQTKSTGNFHSTARLIVSWKAPAPVAPVAEEHDTDVLGTPGLHCPCRPGGKREIARYDAGGAENPIRDVNQVHRSAPSAAQARLPAQNLGKRRLDIAALGKHMAMPAMAREQ